MTNIKKILWLGVAIVFACLCSRIAKAQDCCFSPKLLKKDTILTKAGIYVIEPKPGYQANIKYELIPVVIPVITFYDNIVNLMVYSGTWYNGVTNASGFQGNTISYSNLIGNTITFQFTGKKLEVFGEFKTGHGNVGIVMDASPEILINLGGTNTGPGIIRTFDLTPGFHTVKLRVAEARYIVFDGMCVTN